MLAKKTMFRRPAEFSETESLLNGTRINIASTHYPESLTSKDRKTIKLKDAEWATQRSDRV